MQTFVLDTSVAVAWYLPERFSPAARRWQEAMLDSRAALVVPRLHYWEMANVLRTYVRRDEIDAELAIALYRLHLDAPLINRDPEPAAVLATALQYDTTAYDAVYIALALAGDAVLLTAERSTTPWVVQLGERVERVQA